MKSTARRQAILPHEMQEIETVFDEILREQALPRSCDAAEWIARRLFAFYQSGVRDSKALKALASPDADSIGGPVSVM